MSLCDIYRQKVMSINLPKNPESCKVHCSTFTLNVLKKLYNAFFDFSRI
ncbi:hypothetical protein GKODMF_03550 [Candidatus Electrothrix gigas]